MLEWQPKDQPAKVGGISFRGRRFDVKSRSGIVGHRVPYRHVVRAIHSHDPAILEASDPRPCVSQTSSREDREHAMAYEERPASRGRGHDASWGNSANARAEKPALKDVPVVGAGPR